MSKRTNIQWCHSTVNPCMGCDGCELWPAAPYQILASLKRELNAKGLEDIGRQSSTQVKTALGALERLLKGRPLSEIYGARAAMADQVEAEAPGCGNAVERLIRRAAKCYSGLLGVNRAGHAGYADCFEVPKRFPGRMLKAANWAPPSPVEVVSKPWLAGLPRLIFISDMGDALSAGIDFPYLEQEVIRNVSSTPGRRHLWLWLTKRPSRMAQFGAWLAQRGIAWPENLVAMTTVTSTRTLSRVDALRKVPSRFKGLSLEPLFGPAAPSLAGIDWVIVGGGSDFLAEPFHVEWALDLRAHCEAAGVAFFLKQLGRNPFRQGKPFPLANGHGGDWNEWPTTKASRSYSTPPSHKNYTRSWTTALSASKKPRRFLTVNLTE